MTRALVVASLLPLAVFGFAFGRFLALRAVCRFRGHELEGLQVGAYGAPPLWDRCRRCMRWVRP
jgi:hypothetical protein